MPREVYSASAELNALQAKAKTLLIPLEARERDPAPRRDDPVPR
jgi:hypothetical protein